LRAMATLQETNADGPQWAAKWFAFWEPIEIKLWRKSETILFARFKMLVGALLTLLTQMQYIDISPVMPFFPEKWRSILEFLFACLPLTLTLLGMMDERLRWVTTKPVELVAIREEDVPLEVRRAIVEAEAAKKIAVTEVKVAKELGEIPK